MGAILLIEDDRNIHGLLEKIFPKEDIKIIKTYPGGIEKENGSSDRPADKNSAAPALEEAVREYLKAEMGMAKSANIRGSVIGEVDKALIGIILEEEKGNQVQAAKRLGINRNTLRKRIKELNIITRLITQ